MDRENFSSASRNLPCVSSTRAFCPTFCADCRDLDLLHGASHGLHAGTRRRRNARSGAGRLAEVTFKLTAMVMVAGRGMITSARVHELRELGGFGWVTALRAPAIAALAADDGPLQMSLFDQVNLAEITHPNYPGERLSRAATPPWPLSGPANAWHCWQQPTRN